MIYSSLEFVIVLFAFLYFIIEEGLWAKKFWFIISIFFLAFAYAIFAFFRNLWKIRHLKNHVYVDCGPEGICINDRPSLENSRSVFYCWEEIEYLNYHIGLVVFMLRVKPYKKRKQVYKFNYWRLTNTYFWGFYKAIRQFSGRKDIIQKEHIPRPFE